MAVSNLLFYETKGSKSLKLSVLIILKCSQLFIKQQNISPFTQQIVHGGNKYSGLKYKYKYFKLVLEYYNSSTSTNTKYYMSVR